MVDRIADIAFHLFDYDTNYTINYSFVPVKRIENRIFAHLDQNTKFSRKTFIRGC